MTYGLYDDDDLDAWITQQANDAALSGLLEPDGYAPPPRAAYEPVQMAPLNIDNGPDWSDALGAGTTALAALADLGFNKGRGTGQILAAGGAFGQARADQRLRQTQDALNYEEKRAQNERQNRQDAERSRYNDYLYASLGERARKAGVTERQADERIGVSKVNAATKADANARANRQAESDQFIDYAATKGYDLEGLRGSTMTQIRSAMGPLVKEWELEHAGEKAKATRAGTIEAELEAEPDTTAAAGRRAGAVAAAQAPYRVQVAGESATAREVGQQRGKEQAAEGLTIPGLIETDSNAAMRAKADPVTLRKIQDSGGALATARDALAEMIQIRKQYGTELPGNAKSRFDLAQVAINGALTELGRTGVLSNEERNYYMSMVPNLSLGWTDALRPGGKDIKLEQLGGAMSEFTNLANSKLRAYGYGLGDGSRPAPQPAAPQGVNDATGWQDTIAPLGGRSVQSTPDFPGSSGRAGTNPPYTGPTQYSGPPTGSRQHPFPKGDTVMMESPNGIVGPVPRDKVQIAISRRWKLVQ